MYQNKEKSKREDEDLIVNIMNNFVIRMIDSCIKINLQSLYKVMNYDIVINVY